MAPDSKKFKKWLKQAMQRHERFLNYCKMMQITLGLVDAIYLSPTGD